MSIGLGMDLGPHANFILAAYGIALLVLLVLIAWIALDYRLQRRRVAELESQGITRRSVQAKVEARVLHERPRMSVAPDSPAPVRKGRLIVLLPLAVFLALAALFLFRLGSGDPSKLPSALIGRQVPDTPLPAIEGLVRDGTPVPGIASADFKGAVSLVNVWASWCVPCHDEAPLLLKIAEDKRIRVLGINYKDQPENARRFIGRYGNPFAAVGTDANGRASIDWGVYGVPETFVIDRDGRIAFKLVGPITPQNLEQALKPQIEKALASPRS